MTPQQVEDVRRRMAEAVLLPPEHPLRQSVVADVAVADGELEREWLELVREDERLRVELVRLKPPPADLRQRLLEIAARTPPKPRPLASRWWLAGAVLLAVLSAVWGAAMIAR